MIGVDAYLLIVASVFGAVILTVLILGLRQKQEDAAAEGHDVPAE